MSEPCKELKELLTGLNGSFLGFQVMWWGCREPLVGEEEAQTGQWLLGQTWALVMTPLEKVTNVSIQILFPKPAGKVNHCKVFWLGETITCFIQNSSALLEQTIKARRGALC